MNSKFEVPPMKEVMRGKQVNEVRAIERIKLATEANLVSTDAEREVESGASFSSGDDAAELEMTSEYDNRSVIVDRLSLDESCRQTTEDKSKTNPGEPVESVKRAYVETSLDDLSYCSSSASDDDDDDDLQQVIVEPAKCSPIAGGNN